MKIIESKYMDSLIESVQNNIYHFIHTPMPRCIVKLGYKIKENRQTGLVYGAVVVLIDTAGVELHYNFVEDNKDLFEKEAKLEIKKVIIKIYEYVDSNFVDKVMISNKSSEREIIINRK